MKKYYVGIVPKTLRHRMFRANSTPTFATHGEAYVYVIGPFRTRRGADLMAKHGRNNPHCRCVDEAERLAERLAVYFDREVT